jgi:hypothetical protein
MAVANFSLLEEQIAPLLVALRRLIAGDGVLFIQMVHPWTCAPPYRNGWRREDFRGFGQSQWQAMPWYFRTLGSWIGVLRECRHQIIAIDEPAHPKTAQPLSLLLAAAP